MPLLLLSYQPLLLQLLSLQSFMSKPLNLHLLNHKILNLPNLNTLKAKLLRLISQFSTMISLLEKGQFGTEKSVAQQLNIPSQNNFGTEFATQFFCRIIARRKVFGTEFFTPSQCWDGNRERIYWRLE